MFNFIDIFIPVNGCVGMCHGLCIVRGFMMLSMLGWILDTEILLLRDILIIGNVI